MFFSVNDKVWTIPDSGTRNDHICSLNELGTVKKMTLIDHSMVTPQ